MIKKTREGRVSGTSLLKHERRESSGGGFGAFGWGMFTGAMAMWLATWLFPVLQHS